MEKDIEWNIPVRVPMFDISSIGSGGGSIAWIDKGGALNVGPQSAGADPGPACYGKGGLEPTITDANIILGTLNPDNFLGGEMILNKPAAEQAIQEKIAEPYGWDVLTSSLAVFKIACANMGHLLNERTVMCGLDPRDFSMVTFGGSGALFAGRLAAEIGIPTVIVPPYPALFSALGCLLADTKYDYVRSYLRGAREIEMETLNGLCRQIMEDCNKDLKLEETSMAVEYRYSIDLRYVGEFFEITVPFTFGDRCTRGDLEKSIESLHQEHERLYGFKRPYQPVEIVSLRLSASIPAQRHELLRPGPIGPAANGKPKATRDVFFEELTGFVSTPIFDRDSLPGGASLKGPAIIEESTCTTVIFPDQKANIDAYHNIIIETTQKGVHDDV
jgi:N-methylhydantoinase A/oxoprolinase/acetone carboxylase beta subunit